MTQKYIGVKMVEAWEQEKDGEAGYAVKYPDGYISWSPKAVFEAAYFPLGEDNDGTAITEQNVLDMLEREGDDVYEGAEVVRMANHTVVCEATRTGFTLVEESACVSPENYSDAIGARLARDKIKQRVWHVLGFVLAWARNGLKFAQAERKYRELHDEKAGASEL